MLWWTLFPLRVRALIPQRFQCHSSAADVHVVNRWVQALSEHHTAKHRSAPVDRTGKRRGFRLAALLSGVSLAATGLVVGGGVLVASTPASGSGAALSNAGAASPAAQSLSQADLADRDTPTVSRSEDRVPLASLARSRKLSNASGPARTGSEDLSSADPRTLTKALMPQFGMSPSDFGCIDAIWTQESGWNIHADNPSSSAYGIPQALPGSKMSSAGPDWQNNPVTQIKWGLGYIKSRYGSACAAAGYKQSHGTY